jgi:hypothetical protein
MKIEEETHAHLKRARSTLSIATVMHHKSGVLGPTRQES